MKPTSVISLIVSVFLIVAGLVTCFVAQNIAHANGEFLFSENRGDDYVKSVDIGADISKIELIVEEADINIYGQSERSYIEFVNFSENYYSLSILNTILSFDEIPDIASMFKFWENGFSFKGMRYILNLNSQPKENLKKSVNVYITTEQKIKIFDIEASKCTINMENMHSNTDYNITVNETEINTDNIITNSAFNINSGEKENAASRVKLNMKSTTLNNFNINSQELNFEADMLIFYGQAYLKCDSGNIALGFTQVPHTLNLDIKSQLGKIVVENEEYMHSYAYLGDEPSNAIFKIDSEKADIYISKSQSAKKNSTGRNNP